MQCCKSVSAFVWIDDKVNRETFPIMINTRTIIQLRKKITEILQSPNRENTISVLKTKYWHKNAFYKNDTKCRSTSTKTSRLVMIPFFTLTQRYNNLLESTLEQGSGTSLTQRAMKTKYLEFYFSESCKIYLKISIKATSGLRAICSRLLNLSLPIAQKRLFSLIIYWYFPINIILGLEWFHHHIALIFLSIRFS